MTPLEPPSGISLFFLFCVEAVEIAACDEKDAEGSFPLIAAGEEGIGDLERKGTLDGKEEIGPFDRVQETQRTCDDVGFLHGQLLGRDDRFQAIPRGCRAALIGLSREIMVRGEAAGE